MCSNALWAMNLVVLLPALPAKGSSFSHRHCICIQLHNCQGSQTNGPLLLVFPTPPPPSPRKLDDRCQYAPHRGAQDTAANKYNPNLHLQNISEPQVT